MAVTAPRGARMPALWRARRPVAAAALALAAAVAFLAIPAYSAFDSIWSLVWGQEIAHGRMPSFDAYRAPTEHPLWVAVSVLLAPLGDAGSRALVGLCVAGWVALVIAAFRLAAATLGEAAAWVAAVLVASRLDYAFFAIRGYLDVPFLAFVVWAAALEAERPRRGGAVWALLIGAGLLRPEAWLLAGIYALWLGLGVRRAVCAAAAPLTWFAVDAAVTGDPLYSLHYTTRSALALGRRVPLEDLPERLAHFMLALTKPPVLAAGAAGALLAWRLVRPRRRLALPAFLALFGVATFLATSVRGFAVVDRYLALSALAVTLFAAFAVTGWTRLRPGAARTGWAAAAAVAVVLGAAWTLARLDLGDLRWQLESRRQVHADLVALLDDPRVRAARRCGPVTVPNHKLVPDVRFILDAGGDAVLPRSTLPDAGRQRRGPALFVTGRRFLLHPAYGPFDQLDDSPLVQSPGPDFERVAIGRYITAYVAC
jgi:hypothetical protein